MKIYHEPIIRSIRRVLVIVTVMNYACYREFLVASHTLDESPAKHFLVSALRFENGIIILDALCAAGLVAVLPLPSCCASHMNSGGRGGGGGWGQSGSDFFHFKPLGKGGFYDCTAETHYYSNTGVSNSIPWRSCTPTHSEK